MDELRHGIPDDTPADETTLREGAPSQGEWARVVDRVAAYSPDLEPALPPGGEPAPPVAAFEPLPELPEPAPEPPLPQSPDPEPEAPAAALDAQPEHEAQPEPEADNEVGEESAAEESTGRRSRLRSRGGKQKPEKRKPEKRAKGSRGDKRPRKLVGLKIGASQIAAARVVNNGAPELVEAVREPLEPGVVVAGEIRDADVLAASLKRFFDLHKLPKKGVRLGLSNNRIGVRTFEIEGVADDKQLENAIRFRAEEVLPIPLEEAVLDYVVLGDETREDGTQVKRILLVVAYREVVDRYLQACRGAGLEVVGIDLEAFALLRSLAAPTDEVAAGGALIAIAIGHDRTTIAVSNGRVCEFTRVLDWGGWSLNVAIARELDKAPSEVEHIKRRLSLTGPSEIEELSPEQVAKVRDGVERAVSAFSRELVSSLHFYQGQPGALGIGEVVVTGGTAHMDGLPEMLGRLVGVPVRLGDPFRRLKVSGAVGDESQRGSLAVAIGLGIED